MRNLLALLIPSALLYGCWDETDLPPMTVTPAGYRISFQDQGSMALHDVYVLFDQAVEDAAIYLWRYGITHAQVVAAAKGYPFIIHDEFYFPTSGSGTGYATGQIIYGKAIVLAFYSRQRNASGPAWTWFDFDGGSLMQSGALPAVPALAHELAHHFFGANSEHVPGYPVIVNQPPAGSWRVGLACKTCVLDG
jgi:hypothetical protein